MKLVPTGVLGDSILGLNPAYFGMVMATGIVSIAASIEQWHELSVALLWVSIVSYAALVVLNLLRLIYFRENVARDLRVPNRTFGFFTIVAGTGVVGARLVMDGHVTVAMVLLGLNAALWLIFGYVLPPLAFTVRGGLPRLERADGTWFLWVVATQSVAVLSAAIQPHVTAGRTELALLAVFCWAVGVFLYMAVALFVAFRVFMYHPKPGQLSGAYWIAMGATAITVVAGANIATMVDVPILRITRETIEAVSLFFWAFGTWLIPPLVFAGYWRHGIHKVSLRYDISFWSIVFPLGMYGVGCHQLGMVNKMPILDAVGHVEIWVAVAAWALTFAGFLAKVFGWSRTAADGYRSRLG
ncbi:tellurite resistance/C4-dicarboxylate transporter family protein [Gordonia phthalatica]|uniref:Tellurite resistance protein permease n=1 Tax=Gordonia phthalatica TaxID=1136941 RepID=A0A0N9N1B5_9ACTN|nr:tellurite resistance/C4-dicarboxylate transporter family protein [Gordonia phthalatica]ALG83914.1 tellurite resistance protein permease [Gordonia phthalatica]